MRGFGYAIRLPDGLTRALAAGALPLRVRLSMLAVVLVAAGLLAAGIATRYELEAS